jgi:hypothetical protein
MNMVNLGPLSCGAWLEVSTAEGRRRTCVLAAGHYRETEGPAVGENPSWHTDCLGAERASEPLEGRHGLNREVRCDGRACSVWADWADGAHPSEAPVMSFMESVIRAASDGPVMPPVELPAYVANVSFDTADGERVVSATLYGPAEFLATAVGSITEAFRDEVEK